MREFNLLRLVQAFICSRITYSAPYLRFTRAESERLETSLRKAYKTALGLPLSTATHKLMALGITNTVWTCTRYGTDNTNTLESWESLLRASEPANQRRLIQRAVEAAVSQGFPADLL
ncbi:hypothetical protein HPB50_001206 [Hyalomma asiaticum]|uniref:Uncharacterized protein n=1 Tax=Hyalomma asiaticum TaxID=266040 RepID=A0ACB7TCW8_HYAAI|nr:hypothetical protein HPB50_001206 [Hyalomma asiaticum]